jgi:hypothetical protein
MISGHPAAMELFQNRADQLLRKPFHRADLEHEVDDLCERAEVISPRIALLAVE